jgi:hypothetical protein
VSFLRFLFILFSLILLSEIPSNEGVFFKARLAFYGMLLLDYINLYRSNKGYEKHYACFGLAVTAFICLVDILGLVNFIQLNDGILGPNEKYILMKWFPSVTLAQYIVTFSLATFFTSSGEVILKVFRYKVTEPIEKKKSKRGKQVVDF